jgi:hypothetical protein
MIRVVPGPAAAAGRRRSHAQSATATDATAATPIQPRGIPPGAGRAGATDVRGKPRSTARRGGRPASTRGRLNPGTAPARTSARRSDAPPLGVRSDVTARPLLSAGRPCGAAFVASCSAGVPTAADSCVTAAPAFPPSASVAAPRGARLVVSDAASAATRCDVAGPGGPAPVSPAPDPGATAGADAAGGGASFVAGGPTGAASFWGRNRSGSR